MLVIKAWIAFCPAVQRNCLSTIHRSNGGELVQYSTDRMSDPASFLIFNVLLFYTDMLFYFHFHFNLLLLLLLLLLLPFLLFSSCLQWHRFMAIIQQQRSSVHFFLSTGKRIEKKNCSSLNVSSQTLSTFPDVMGQVCSSNWISFQIFKRSTFFNSNGDALDSLNRFFFMIYNRCDLFISIDRFVKVEVAWAWACRDVTDALIDRL